MLLKVILILSALSLDGFVVMMQTGATVRNLKWKKRFVLALIYALISTVTVLIGFGGAYLIRDTTSMKVEITIASLIIFAIGLYLIMKGIVLNKFEEKLDKDFNYKKFAKLTFITNIDTLCLGAGFSFLSVHLIAALLSTLIIEFLNVVVALSVGYNLGAGYQKIIGFVGGALLVFFSVWILAINLLV